MLGLKQIELDFTERNKGKKAEINGLPASKAGLFKGVFLV